MDSVWLYPLIGLLCGIFSALFGVGSGIIMVPALVLVAELSQKSAQGMALAIMVPMALTGAIRYKMDPVNQMDMKLVAILSVAGVLGALMGYWLVTKISGETIRKVFAVIMIVTAIKMFFTPEKKPAAPAAGADGGKAAATAVEPAPAPDPNSGQKPSSP
jgi:uncharacterized protein